MTDSFQYDIFLSHSSKDKPVVRDIAERLRADGLIVWFDDWEIRPGDSIPAKIEEGLEHSRVLVLCMSANAFGSEWAQLEAGTFRFRDPLNKDRRFIPLRLDDAPIKGSLAQFSYIDWSPEDPDQKSAKLLEACRASTNQPVGEMAQEIEQPAPYPRAAQSHALQIHVSPTRNGRRQLAQIRVLNLGLRPILIDAWFVLWNDKSMSTSILCQNGVLPVRLQDHERAELFVEIGKHPIEQLEGLGVVDAEQTYWYADSKQMRRFIHTAKLHRPPHIESPTEQASEPSAISISVAVTASSINASKRLEVRLKNLGPRDLDPQRATVEWNCHPPRELPNDPGEPRVAECGGSVSLQRDGPALALPPNDETVFFLGSQEPLAQAVVAVLSDDVLDNQLRVTVTASRYKWTAIGDEVSGAIREFARAVLHNM
jgi:hypothetical protein